MMNTNTSTNRSSVSLSSSLRQCFDLLKEGEKIIQTDQKDAILVLGNTGAGKTTLVQFLTGNGNELLSQEAAPDTGEFVIVDKRQKISSDSTLVSKTIFPELSIDFENHYGIYDCPGFDDTRGSANDIAGTYFVRKVINSVRRIKLLLTVNYSSVRVGVDRSDFLDLVRHVLSLVKNIEKYCDSVAIVVTKVENQYVKKKKSKEPMLVTDDDVREYVASFLHKFKINIAKIADPSFTTKAIKLIDALLIKTGSTYERIGLFRRPDEEGLLDKINLFKDGKQFIKKILTQYIYFTPIDPDDFGYAISDKSKNELNDLIKEVGKTVKLHVEAICNELEEQIEYSCSQSNDIRQFEEYVITVLQKIKAFKDSIEYGTNLKDFIHKFLNLITELRVNASKNNFLVILQQEKYLDFLELVGERSIDNSELLLIEGIRHITKYLEELQIWYKFFHNLFDYLSSYKVQKNKLNYMYLVQPKITYLDDERLKKFLEGYNNFNINELKLLAINDNRILTLDTIIKSALNTSVSIKYDDENKLWTIFGEYVVLSEIRDEDIFNHELVNVFATNKIFIDKNMTRIGSKLNDLVFIAPTWEVVGTNKIILDGANGQSNKTISRSDGESGQPGLPGESGANFFGIVQTFVNSEDLQITANGGYGGPGENGMAGTPGIDGASPIYIMPDGSWETNNFGFFETDYLWGFFFSKHCIYGKRGSAGEKGGDGGAGGKGGLHGNVTIEALGNKSLISIQAVDGQKGFDGIGGKGGFGGKSGKSVNADKFLFWWLHFSKERSKELAHKYGDCSENDYSRNGKSGLDGLTGGIISIKKPEQSIIANRALILINYEKYLYHSLILEQLNKQNKVEFLTQLNRSPSLIKLYSELDLVNKFFDMENEYQSIKDNFDWLVQYEWLLQIVEFQLTTSNYIPILKHLQRAIISKLCLLKVRAQKTVITQVAEYLHTESDNLKTFQQRDDIFNIKQVHKNLQFQLENASVNIANRTLQNNKKICNMVNLLEQNIETFLNKVVDNGYDEDTSKNKHALEETLILLNILQSMKEINQFLGVIRSIVTKIININEPMANKYYFQSDSYINIKNQIHNILNQTFQMETNLLQSQFNNMLKEVSISAQASKDLQSSANLALAAINNIGNNTMVLQTKKLFQSLFDQLKKDRYTSQKNFQVSYDILKIIYYLKDVKVLKIGSSSFPKRFETLISLIRQSGIYDHIQFYREQLRYTIEYHLDFSFDHILNFVADIDQIPFKKTLSEIKLNLLQMKRSVILPEDLLYIFEQIESDVNSMFDFFQSVSYYQELTRLIMTVNDEVLSSPTDDISQNNDFLNIINSLKAILGSNLALHQYQVMMKNINQLVFPFGNQYFHEFNVKGDEKNIPNSAVHNIQLMQATISKQGLYLNTENSKLVFDGEFNNNDNNMNPFYIWQNKHHRNAITELLAGNEVTLKADILHSISQDAVKFNKILLKFVCRDESLQSELEADLSNLQVTMIHGAESYFKCNNEFYVLTYEPQTIAYSFQTKPNGEPEYKNLVYDNIKNGVAVLSPYTDWKIKLDGGPYEKLARYKDWVDLYLEGEGTWMKDGEKYCDPEVLRNFYTLDDSILETNAITEEVLDLSTALQPEIVDLRAETNVTQQVRHRRSPKVHQMLRVKEPIITVNKMSAPLLIGSTAKHLIGLETTRNQRTAAVCALTPYSLNDCLLLLDLLVRRVTEANPHYFGHCSTNFVGVRFCSLEIVKNFENLLAALSDDEALSNFDPVLLMERVEKNIIDKNGQNIGEILLSSIQNDGLLQKEEFFDHLRERIAADLTVPGEFS